MKGIQGDSNIVSHPYPRGDNGAFNRTCLYNYSFVRACLLLGNILEVSDIILSMGLFLKSRIRYFVFLQ